MNTMNNSTVETYERLRSLLCCNAIGGLEALDALHATNSLLIQNKLVVPEVARLESERAAWKGRFESAEKLYRNCHIKLVNAERELNALKHPAPSSACHKQSDALAAAEDALSDIVGVISDSHGIAGYHLNGDVFGWDEGTDPLGPKCEAALAKLRAVKSEAGEKGAAQ